MNKKLAILLLGVITALKPSSAQEIADLIIDPTIRDFVEINPQVQLHYASTGFSIDKIVVFDDYSLIFSHTGAKLYLIDNTNHLIQDEWDFRKDGKIKLNDIRFSPGENDKGKHIYAWRYKTPFLPFYETQINALPDSGKVTLGKVHKSMHDYFFFCATVKNGKIEYELVPIEPKNIIPESFKKYGNYNKAWPTQSYLKLNNSRLFTLWSYPNPSSNDKGKTINEAKIKNILIRQDKNGIPTAVEFDEVQNNEKYPGNCYVFRHRGKILLLKVKEQTITIYDNNLTTSRVIDLKPDLKKNFNCYSKGFYNCTVYKDEKCEDLWVSITAYNDSLKKPIYHLVKIDIENEKIIQTHKTIEYDKDLSVIPQFVYNQTLYFKANPSDIDYSAIFKINLEQDKGDTVFLKRSNNITITLFDKKVYNFGISHKQAYNPLPSKTTEALGLRNNQRLKIDSLTLLASKAVEYLEHKDDLRFASELCLYDSHNLGRITFLEKCNQLKNVPVFNSDSEREIMLMLMKRLQKSIKDVDFEQKSCFMEATTPEGWRFIIVKTSNGYRFGSSFFKKV